MQFHLEASHRKVTEWMVKYRDMLPRTGKSPEEMLADFARTAAERERLCDVFMGNFLRAADWSR